MRTNNSYISIQILSTSNGHSKIRTKVFLNSSSELPDLKHGVTIIFYRERDRFQKTNFELQLTLIRDLLLPPKTPMAGHYNKNGRIENPRTPD